MPDQIELLGYSRDLGDFLSEGMANSRVAPYVEPPEKKHRDQTLIPRMFAEAEEEEYDGPFAVSISGDMGVSVKNNFYANIWDNSYVDRQKLPDTVLNFSEETNFQANYYVILRMGANGIELGYMKSDEWHAYVIAKIAEVSFNPETGKISSIVQLFNSHLSPSNIYILGANGGLVNFINGQPTRYLVADSGSLLMFYYDGPGACLPISDTMVLVKSGKITSSYAIGSSYGRTRENTITEETVVLNASTKSFDFCWHQGELLVTYNGERSKIGYTLLCQIASFEFNGTKITSANFPLWSNLEKNTSETLGKEYSFVKCNDNGLFFSETRLIIEWFDENNYYIGWRGKYQKVYVSGLKNTRIYYSPVSEECFSRSGVLNVEPCVGQYPNGYDRNYSEDPPHQPYYPKDANTLVLDMSGVRIGCSSWGKIYPRDTLIEVPWGGSNIRYVGIKLSLSNGTLIDDLFNSTSEPQETDTTAYITILHIEPSGYVFYHPGPYNFYWRCY